MNPYEGMTPEPWMASGTCATTGNPDDWFADEGMRGKRMESYTRQAIEACRSCPVQQTCLEYAIDEEIPYGVWGGVTAQGRRRLKLSVVA